MKWGWIPSKPTAFDFILRMALTTSVCSTLANSNEPCRGERDNVLALGVDCVLTNSLLSWFGSMLSVIEFVLEFIPHWRRFFHRVFWEVDDLNAHQKNAALLA